MMQTEVEDIVDEYEIVDEYIRRNKISTNIGNLENVNDGRVYLKGSIKAIEGSAENK